MSDITIPPEAVEAMRGILRVYFQGYQDAVIDDICAETARAALKAWPGMNTGPNIYGRQEAIMHLPLMENTNVEG